MNARTYYKVNNNGFTRAQINKFQDENKQTRDSYIKFAEKYKAEKSYESDILIALVFDNPNDVPEGWASAKNMPNNCYKPMRRKISMEAYSDYKKLGRKLRGHDLARMLGTGTPTDVRKMYLPSFELIGDILILDLHPDHKVPEGVTQLKTSEYWSIKENHEQG